MSLRPEDLVILEPGNDGDSDIDVEVDELFDRNVSVDTSCLIQKGMIFDSKEDLMLAVKRYCVTQHYEIVVVESNQHLWNIRCKQWTNGCNWRLRGTKRKSHGLFEITKLQGEHSCLYSNLTQDHSQLDSNFMSVQIQNMVKADPTITVSVLMEIIKQQYGYGVKYGQVWQAKKKALITVFGDWEKSYNELPYWLSAVVHYNPGTRVDWFFLPSDVPGTTIFGRVFWSFGPAIEGFKHCRPLIQIDGTHLYGKYKGKMLTALSIDANGHIFPLAFAIVEGENTSSWSWFLRALREYVTDRYGICLISDRHRDILSAINNEEVGWSEPRAVHRYCLRHVASNFNQKYKSKQLKDLVFRAGNQHQRRKFIKIMKELQRLNPECLEFFEDIDVEKWTQSHDNGSRYGWMTSNAAECMNGVFKGARMLPITSLVRLTFYRTILYFERRRAEISEALDRGDIYTKYAIRKLKKWEKRASAHSVTSIDRETQTFEVHTGMSMTSPYKGQHTQVVSLMEGTCSCNKWQSFKIPCSHVIAICNYMHLTYVPYIDECYLLSTFKRCYDGRFHPIQHSDYWPEISFTEVRPNADLLKGPGRPRTTRIQNEMDWKESSQSIRCTICKVEGHNRRTCPERASSSRH
ncbi:uncharacterized protein LOC116402427 [Cucumis sativus]|uniref:uncharacterized protein LOC116402427 n=1 Tax=Cucumis sativus TaxID=3659 RepID=UPI0012F4A5CD|nr:uncharacterized protein LOC116402427 [Cucumis sativus]